MASVRASKRVSISWSSQEPFEDTDTLVLTINSWSLDLRVFNSGPEKGQIDWATVANVREIEGSTRENPKLTWDHLIDSRPPSDLPDQGTFESLPNGDVIESGIMFNPKTGENEGYIETWRRYTGSKNEPFCVLERVGEGRAYLGRIGDRALGLGIKPDGTFMAYREEVVGGEWKTIYASAEDIDLPSLPISLEGFEDGAEVEIGGCRWKVQTVGRI